MIFFFFFFLPTGVSAGLGTLPATYKMLDRYLMNK